MTHSKLIHFNLRRLILLTLIYAVIQIKVLNYKLMLNVIFQNSLADYALIAETLLKVDENMLEAVQRFHFDLGAF